MDSIMSRPEVVARREELRESAPSGVCSQDVEEELERQVRAGEVVEPLEPFAVYERGESFAVFDPASFVDVDRPHAARRRFRSWWSGFLADERRGRL